MTKKKLKVIYKSNWDTATPEQKKQIQQNINDAYDMLFRKVVERKARDLLDEK